MSSRLCIFGEVLFDHFPDGKSVLGGAPFNVAWHLQAFGQTPDFISRVGSDAEGEAVRSAMAEWGMNTRHLQTDKQHPTGKVQVTFSDGEPAYDIVQPCAYDAMAPLTEVWSCGLLYHGSLALRGEPSRQVLEQLKAARPQTVFIDVNLRPPWYQLQQIQAMLHTANWVKLNSDELKLLYPAAAADAAKTVDFLRDYGLDGLVLTHGGNGAELITGSGEVFRVKPENDIEVVDTVGAGDAFVSVIILGLRNDWPLDVTLQRAQLFASHIVGQRGATVSDADFYQTFIDLWNLAA
jgi:fructokinase